MKINRILMINDHISFGGGGDAAFRLERAVYEDAGYEVFTYSQSTTQSDGSSVRDIVCPEFPSRFLRKATKFTFEPRVYFALKHLIQKIHPDIIKIHLVSKYPLSIYAALIGADCPVIQVLHGPNLFCTNSWGCLKKSGEECEMGIGIKCVLRGCVSIFTLIPYLLMNIFLKPLVHNTVSLYLSPSHHLHKSAESLGYKPTEFMPLSVDQTFCDAIPAVFDGPPTILYVGALVEQKGVHILLDAFRMVIKRVPDARLLLAGRGIMETRLRELVVQYEIIDNVTFLGFVGRQDVVDLYRKAHVLAVPSIWKEQFGLVGPEALSCGVPCVGSAVGGIPEWLHDAKWGFLVPPRDPNILAERLVQILSDKVLRNSFAKAGREYALSEYSVDRYRENLLNCLKRVG